MTVEHGRDMKIIIANVLQNSNEIHHQRQQSMLKIPCMLKYHKMHAKRDFFAYVFRCVNHPPPCTHGVRGSLTPSLSCVDTK